MKKGISLFCAIILVLSLAALPGCAKTDEAEKESPMKIIVDCDINGMNDDALALTMLYRLQKAGKVEIVGISVSGGNVFVGARHTTRYGLQETSVQSAEEFVRLAEADTPVYAGLDYPKGFSAENEETIDLCRRTFINEVGERENRVIMNDAFGALWHFSDYDGVLSEDEAAADFLADAAAKAPGEITLIVIGGSGNVARALEKHPEMAQNYKALYMMSGAFGDMTEAVTDSGETVLAVPGANTTNMAEYNVFYDPESFRDVILAGFPKVVISPGDIFADVPEDLADSLRKAGEEQGSNALLEAWIDYHASFVQDYPYWDPIVPYALMNPDKVTAEEGYVTVCADPESEFWGRTEFITDEEYKSLSEEDRASWAAASVITAHEGFWDWTLPLLAGK